MRLLPLLLVSVSLVMAGCSKEEDTPADGDGTPVTTTTPNDAGNTTTTPATDPTGGENDTSPAAPTPMELCAKTKDFTPPGQSPHPPNPTPVSSEVCGTPGAGYTTISLNVTWAPATAVPATTPASPPTVKLLDSTGAAAATCAGPTGQTTTGECMLEAPIVPGEYTLQYENAGNLKATISVMVR